MADWKPIETAPTDSEEDILVGSAEYVTLGFFRDGVWYDATFDSEHVTGTPMKPQPIAWQPKPSPPTAR